jgi:hypothetical protein
VVIKPTSFATKHRGAFRIAKSIAWRFKARMLLCVGCVETQWIRGTRHAMTTGEALTSTTIMYIAYTVLDVAHLFCDYVTILTT